MGKPFSETLTLQSAVAATANGSAIDVTGYGSLALQITGTFSATITFQGSLDGSNWVSLQAVSVTTGGAVSSATATGLYFVNVAGLAFFRAPVTWTSGTSVTVVARAATSGGGVPGAGAGSGSGITFTITGATVAANTTAYASGDCLGAKLTLSDAALGSGGVVYLQSVVVQDLTAQSAAMDLIIFNANPSSTTFTNNSALDIADADLPKVAAIVKVLASDYVTFSDCNAAQPEFNPRMIQASGSDDLYAVLVCRGTPTYAANELSLVLGFMRD